MNTERLNKMMEDKKKRLEESIKTQQEEMRIASDFLSHAPAAFAEFTFKFALTRKLYGAYCVSFAHNDIDKVIDVLDSVELMPMFKVKDSCFTSFKPYAEDKDGITYQEVKPSYILQVEAGTGFSSRAEVIAYIKLNDEVYRLSIDIEERTGTYDSIVDNDCNPGIIIYPYYGWRRHTLNNLSWSTDYTECKHDIKKLFNHCMKYASGTPTASGTHVFYGEK